MQLWLGEVPTVVATSMEAAQEILKTRELSFADRHVSPTIRKAFFNGKDVLFSSYGERWRELRKICIVDMLSSGRVRSFRHIREEEVARLVQKLSASAAAGTAVNISERIMKCTNDIVAWGSVGSRCKSSDAVDYLHALRTLVAQLSSLAVAELFPSSKLMQVLSTAPRKALASRDMMERIFQQIIEERKKSMEYGSNGDGEPAARNIEDFLGVLLLQKEGDTVIPITDEIINILLFGLKFRRNFGKIHRNSSLSRWRLASRASPRKAWPAASPAPRLSASPPVRRIGLTGSLCMEGASGRGLLPSSLAHRQTPPPKQNKQSQGLLFKMGRMMRTSQAHQHF